MNIKGLSKEDSRLFEQGLLLPLMEEFQTLQGEGYYSGSAAWFIRLGGCDVGCKWCDVKESWNPNHFPPISTEKIVDNAVASKAKTVVVTGGEPLNYNLDPLCSMLKKYGIDLHMETSGSSELRGSWDWICLSPKKGKPPVDQMFSMANELKMIISDESDFKWAIDSAKKVRPSCVLYLQPEWSRRDEVMSSIVEFIIKNPRWKVSLQTHKYMRIP